MVDDQRGRSPLRQCGHGERQPCPDAAHSSWCTGGLPCRARRRAAGSMLAPISCSAHCAGRRAGSREQEHNRRKPEPGRDRGRQGFAHQGLMHGKRKRRVQSDHGMVGLGPCPAHTCAGKSAQTGTVMYTSTLLAITVFSCLIVSSKSQMNNVVPAPEIISLVADDPDDLDGAALRHAFCTSSAVFISDHAPT